MPIRQIMLSFSLTTITLSYAPDSLASVIYVDVDAQGANNGSSWVDAFTGLRDALALAVLGDEVWVAEGTYKPAPPGGDRNATFQMKDMVSVYGGFAGIEDSRDQRDFVVNLSILSGDLNGDDGPDFENNGENAFHVVNVTGLRSATALDGFAITGGNANGIIGQGGGIYGDFASPVIVDCAIESNSAVSAGAGVYLDVFFDEAAIISGCAFRGNDEADALSTSRNTKVTSCLFVDNERWGASVSDSLVADTAFLNNGFGGLKISGDDDINLAANCLFVGNGFDLSPLSPTGLLAAEFSGLTQVVSCQFIDNGLQSAIEAHGEALEITNCTITHSSKAIFCLGSGTITVSNSISWDNEHFFLPNEDCDNLPVVNHSLIEDWVGQFPGERTSAEDPLFIDPDGPDNIPGNEDDDLHVAIDSPAIDSGDNTAVPADAYDLDGDGDTAEPVPFDLDGLPRLVDPGNPANPNPIVDRGAYEVQFVPGPCDADVNGDGATDPLDAGFVLARLGCTYPNDGDNCLISDLNGDGVVDPLDVGYVLSRFGVCP